MNDAAPLEARGGSVLERLLRYMEEITPPSAPKIGPDTEIFTTGHFESLALVQLVVWVEEELGRPLDPRAFQMTTDWACARDIAAFIERERAGKP